MKSWENKQTNKKNLKKTLIPQLFVHILDTKATSQQTVIVSDSVWK